MNRFTVSVFDRWTRICKKQNLGQDEFNKQIEKLMKKLGEAIKNGDTEATKKIQQDIKDVGTQQQWIKDKVTERQIRQTPHSENNVSELTLEELKERVDEFNKDKFPSGVIVVLVTLLV